MKLSEKTKERCSIVSGIVWKLTLVAAVCYAAVTLGIERHHMIEWKQQVTSAVSSLGEDTARTYTLVEGLIETSLARNVEFEQAWMGLRTQYKEDTDKLMANYKEAMGTQVQLCDDANYLTGQAQTEREEILLAAETFGNLAMTMGEKAMDTEASLQEVLTLAKALKAEVTRVTYAFEKQLQLATNQKEIITDKQAEIDYLWNTIHTARNTVYGLNREIAGLRYELSDAHGIIVLLSSRLWLYEDVDEVLNPPVVIDPIDECDYEYDESDFEEYDYELDYDRGDKADTDDDVASRYHHRNRTKRFFKRGGRKCDTEQLEDEFQLASRYHQRTRTGRFFSRGTILVS